MPWNAIFNLASQYGVSALLLLIGFLVIRLSYNYAKHKEKKRTFKHDEIKLLYEVLQKPSSNSKFLVEQLLETKYGQTLSWREITYLFKLVSPSEALNSYISGRRWLKFSYKNSDIDFNAWLANQRYRSLRKSWNVSCYFLMSLLALALMVVTPWIFTQLGNIIGFQVILIEFSFILCAIFCLKGYAEIRSAEDLIEQVEYVKNNPAIKSRNYLLL